MSLATDLVRRALKPSRYGRIGPLELLVLQSTPFCNLDCDYCYLPNRRLAKRMSLDVVSASVREVLRSGIVDDRFTVLWHAGEPLAPGIRYYEQAIAAIEELRPRKMTINYGIQTNATLLTDEWCEFIGKHGIRIGVSVDGPAAVHDRHRLTRDGKGTHGKVMAGIALLKKHGIPFSSISVLTQQSLAFPDEFFAFCADLGAQPIGLNVEEKEGAHKASTLETEQTREHLSQFIKRLYELNEAHGRRLNFRELSRFEQAILGWSAFGSNARGFLRSQENAPFRILSVDWEGNYSTYSPELLGMDVAPYGKFTLGNILTDRIKDVVKTETFRSIAEAIQRGISRCEQQCHYFSVCGGGSPANKYYENGSFDSHETMHCRLHVQTIAEVVLKKLEQRPHGGQEAAASSPALS